MIESAEEFVRLRSSDKPAEYLRAAREEAPLHVYRDVISRFPEYKEWVAYNKPVPNEILAELAVDPDADIRSRVASRRKLSPELFLMLARDADTGVRCSVVQNAKVTDAALELLRNDSNEWIRKEAQKEKDRRLGLSFRE